MHTSWVRRLGAITAVVVLLSLLLVPAVSAAPGAGSCPPVIHVVSRGETLSGIAARYGVSLQAIMAANGIWNPNVIYAGQRLVIPVCGSYPPPPPPPPPGCYARYTVHRGDNLTRIAYRFGTTVNNLMRCNGISNPNRIYVGQTLCICGARPIVKPTPVPPVMGPWHAQYFNNRDLSGGPVLARNEANLSYNWGYSSPAPQVFADNFSARWQRTSYISTGTYRVTVRADDGVRVSIDNVLVINAWQVQPATTYTQDVIVMAGNHVTTVEYFEAEALAEISFSMPKIAN